MAGEQRAGPPSSPARRAAAAYGWNADIADEDAPCEILALDTAGGSE